MKKNNYFDKSFVKPSMLNLKNVRIFADCKLKQFINSIAISAEVQTTWKNIMKAKTCIPQPEIKCRNCHNSVYFSRGNVLSWYQMCIRPGITA